MTSRQLEELIAALGNNVWVTIENLARYKTKYDTQVTEKLKNAQINASQIIESESKKFVSQVEKNTYADKYTRAEVDRKLGEVTGGLAFRGTFATPSDLPQEGCKDGWLAIVINDPAAQGKNVLYIYETAEVQRLKGVKAAAGKWVKLNDLMIPGAATQSSDGLMSKEDKKKLDGLQNYTHPESHPATMITEDETHKFVTATEKTNIATALSTANAAKEAAATADGKAVAAQNTANSALEKANTNEGKINSLTQTHNQDKQSLEQKIQAVDAKFVAATNEQIDALFADTHKVVGFTIKNASEPTLDKIVK